MDLTLFGKLCRYLARFLAAAIQPAAYSRTGVAAVDGIQLPPARETNGGDCEFDR